MRARHLIRIALGGIIAAVALTVLTAFTGAAPALAQGASPGEIVVVPHPPLAHQPTEIRVVIPNTTTTDLARYAQFYWSDFGIGMERYPIGARRPFTVPNHGEGSTFVVWIPPATRPYCFYAEIFGSPTAPVPIAVFQHNVMTRPYLPLNGTDAFVFGVRNPLSVAASITVGVFGPPVGWASYLDPTPLALGPGAVATRTLLITYTGGPLPPDGVTFGLDGFADRQPIGHIERRLGPPLLLHTRREPFYAESEISVHPYPVMAGRPTEIGVAIHNPTDLMQFADLVVEVAPFGINTLFEPIAVLRVNVPPHYTSVYPVPWVPAVFGRVCIRARLVFEQYPGLFLFSQRNVDVVEFPTPDVQRFPVDNLRGTVSMTLRLIQHFGPLWGATISPRVAPPGELVTATLTISNPDPALDLSQLPNGAPVVDVEGVYHIGQPEEMVVGGIRKVFRRPVPLDVEGDLPYAESEISINPYPPRAGEPVEICTRLFNYSAVTQTVDVYFQAANFGIGLPFAPIAHRQVSLPPHSEQLICQMWVPSYGGHFCVQIVLYTREYGEVISQRNLDVAEPLRPGVMDRFVFPVGNPTPQPATITLGLINHLEGWEVRLDKYVLPGVQPGPQHAISVTMYVTPALTLPESEGVPVVDVEAYIGDQRIGGFRKLFQPPVPIHRPEDPIYAEREIKVRPYPPREREPVEICVEVRNPTDEPHAMVVDFRWAEFGIGLPYHPIRTTEPFTVPAHGLAMPCTIWVAPHAGRFGFEVELRRPGEEKGFVSQRVIDVGEILLPNRPTAFEFPVGNPFSFPITVALGVIKHLPQWEVELEPRVFPLAANARPVTVTMHIMPVQRPGDPEPQEGQPVIDVEAHWRSADEGGLLGGFRKLFFPPMPIHRPEDPIFAEREISIIPYPPQAGEPTRLGMEVRNPTSDTQRMTVTFQVGPFGIGLPFFDISASVVTVTLPPGGRDVVWAPWIPPVAGKVCVRVKVEAPFFDRPFYSTRNVDVVRLPRPYGAPEVFPFVVGGFMTTTRPLTVELGLKEYLADWQVELRPRRVVLGAGQMTATAVLTITPPPDPDMLPKDGGPIADVSGLVEGELIGGIRKVWRPPVPLGHLGEPSYAESEIRVTPDPPVAGQPATIETDVRNNTAQPYTITVEFGWADFGFGIPFSNTNVVPTATQVVLGAYMTDTVSATWTPTHGGSYCVQIILTDDQTNERQHSRRNVDVIEIEPGRTITYPFTYCNPLPITTTVSLAIVTAGLPADWTVTLDPTSATLGPFECISGVMTITQPALWAMGAQALAEAAALNATVDIEGYTQDGNLVGGIELQLGPPTEGKYIYLPLVLRTN